eukprot:403346231
MTLSQEPTNNQVESNRTAQQNTNQYFRINDMIKEESQTPSGQDQEYLSNCVRKRKAISLLVFLSIALFIDYFVLKDLLFNESIKHSQYLRKNYPSINFDLFCQIVSELCDKYGIGVFLILSYHLLDLPKSFTISLCTAFGQGLICMLKSLNNEPRPFFVADLKPYKCRLEHGNPSGHALIMVALYATAVEQFIRQYPRLRANQGKVWTSYILLAAFIGFGRIYNGVHTHNQVIAGYIWGFATYYTFSHLIQYEIYHFIMKVKYMNTVKLIWNPLTQGFVVGYLIQICLYFYGSKHNPTPQLWLDNIVKNCDNVDLHADPELQNFEKYNISFSIIGAYIGVIIDQRLLNLSQFHDFFKTSASLTIKRIFLGIFVSSFCSLPFLVSKHNPFWIVLLCRNILPVLIGSVQIFGGSKYICQQFSLINESKCELSYQKFLGLENTTEAQQTTQGEERQK